MFPTQQNSPPSNPSPQSEKRVKKTLSIVDPSAGKDLTKEILHTKESKDWGSSHRSTSSSGPGSGSRGTPSMAYFEEDSQQTREEFEEKSSDFVTHEIPKESSVADVAEKGDVYGFLADSVKLKSFLSCEKCREEFDKDRKQPLLLPCLNAMCKQCVSNVWASHNTSFECSVCQRVHVCYENESIVLPLDGTRKAALEISHLISGESGIICEMCTNDQLASHRCFDCSYFICSDCTKLHSSLRTFKCHSYTSIKNLFEGEMRSLSMFSNTTYCPVSGHDKEMMKMFCRTDSCMKPVCVICAISAHKNHIICDIAEVANEKRKKIQKLKKSVQLREKQSQVSLAQLTEMNETNFSESERIQKEITACFSKAKEMLDKRRDELCNAVARQQNDKEALIGMERTRLSNFVESCLQACLYVDIAPVINKHPSLYNISKSMEMRLKDLESQSPGCEVTVTLDTMKFVPKELDSTFEKSAASFGELMNTKAFSKRSKAMIKPSVCYVGQEITFQITLVSSLGNKIHDEQVHVYLNLQGENFKIIQCPFEKSSSSFVGKWIPDMAMELSWKVVSNGIEMETLKGTLQIKENCATGYEKAMPLQTEVKMEGGRKRRRFVSDGSDSRPSSSNTDIPSISNTDKFGDTLEVKTKEGLIVKVYEESITRLAVDCIVNAANESLSHGGGVALTISQAAGYGFDQESVEYIRKYGQIPIGECCVTGAGNLPYQYVIHTVGPRWFTYREDEKKDCLDDLQRAVEVTFRKAEVLGMSSIALPAISSGIFGVPTDKCVEQYYRAVVSFSGSNKCYSLREVHFVDRDYDMVEHIKASFIRLKEDSSPQLRDLSSTAHNATVLVQKTNDPNQSEQNYEYKPPLDVDKNCCMFDVTKSLSIYFSVGDILKYKVDAVVCPQDKKCKSREEDAKALFNNINDSTAFPKVKEEGYRFGKIISMEIKKSNVPWRCILHTVAPNFDGYAATEEEKFKKNLQKTYENVFNEADNQKISKIAMPVLGLRASNIHQKPIEICAESFANAVQSFVSDDSQYLREVTVVFRSKADKFVYSDGMKKVGYDDICLLPNVTPAEEENCCICMDTLTNPKRLKCGHVFCTECIEQQFKYKPACPSCGQLYGKMTGDQPPGSVSVRKEWRKLPGYERCDGCIVITYTINGGYQGEEHPNPTKYFKGITRSGYIPNNTKGRSVVKLLNIAFTRRLVFTIGWDRTTGEEGVVTWNDIHHKTRPEGGPQRFGYPDPTYLDRVLEELDAKGVSPESADDPKEYMEYLRCFR